MSSLNKKLNKIMRCSFIKEYKEWQKINLLLEKQHIPDISDLCAERITNYVCDMYLAGEGELEMNIYNGQAKRIKFNIPTNICADIENVYFKDLICDITLSICFSEMAKKIMADKQSSGAYDDTVHHGNLIEYNNNLIFDKIKIEILCLCNNSNIKEKIYSALLHEFNHAYEDYQRLLNKKLTYQDWLESSGYNITIRVLKDPIFDPDRKDLAYVLYNLSKTEINAKISQIYGEIKEKSFNSSYEVITLIKNSEAYLVLDSLFEYINHLEKVTDVDTQNTLLKLYNEVKKRKYSDYKQMLNSLREELEVVLQYVFETAAKTIR